MTPTVMYGSHIKSLRIGLLARTGCARSFEIFCIMILDTNIVYIRGSESTLVGKGCRKHGPCMGCLA